MTIGAGAATKPIIVRVDNVAFSVGGWMKMSVRSLYRRQIVRILQACVQLGSL